jgi:hypothetical protein
MTDAQLDSLGKEIAKALLAGPLRAVIEGKRQSTGFADRVITQTDLENFLRRRFSYRNGESEPRFLSAVRSDTERLVTGPLFRPIETATGKQIYDGRNKHNRGKTMQTMRTLGGNINLRMLVGDCESFDEGLERLEKLAGMSRGRAILTLRQFSGAQYNAWRKKRDWSDCGRNQHL